MFRVVTFEGSHGFPLDVRITAYGFLKENLV
jgi:hypothetical protein